ncbi:HvfC/BufC N-terminal domain-containing protein [Parachitinimonas caeni]|uniref:DNA-binding domain-containing protein n=1 Tax=Parachitinimonas caeni TaxID=3031301 RepID=A0ABT7E206_9NEIS|nr:DNA-binding domain-containing protein [Parachitinimonas caeni]MDK2126284.1 DNA-binding domain-containing protein [Parachitinimonas caeni]
MSQLAELQRAFEAAVADPEADWQSLFGRTCRGVVAYANNSLFNRAGALDDAYPVIRQMVGDEFFEALAREYARTTPSTSPDLNRYGGMLGDFLAGFAPVAHLPYLPDMARLEWAGHLAYYAEDRLVYDWSRLASIPPEQMARLRFRFLPDCALLYSPYPVASIWLAHHGGEWPSLDQGAEWVWVQRQQGKVTVEAITPDRAAWLRGLMAGMPLELAIPAALDINPEFPLSAALAALMTAQAIEEIDLL